MDDELETNLAHWEEAARIHPQTEFYDVQSFLDGASTLQQIEREALGDVTGQSLLHLQCHIGLDSLSWEREGARVTAIDFSPAAIEAARDIRDEAGLETEFIRCDVYDVPRTVGREFDIVFTSYGVLCWLPDLDGWATTISRSLKPGGTFFIVDDHPFADVFDYELERTRSYFDSEGVEYDSEGTYADPDADLEHTTTYQWNHQLSEIVNSLLDAGLRIESLEEYPYTTFEKFGPMVERDGLWYLDDERELPLLFSVEAVEPA